MPFSKPLPVWNAPGTEPPQGKKDAGWLAQEKPPADWWNWYKYTNYQAVQELQQNAIHREEKGVANGVASLGADGKIPPSQLSVTTPPDASTSVKGIVQLNDAINSTSTTQAATANAVKKVYDQLFQFANSGKTNIAAAIGSPATSGDTFSQLQTHIQNGKNTLATNLTNKGQTAAGTETLAALAAKVADVNTGKKFASGTTISANTSTSFQYAGSTGAIGLPTLTVTGLSFKPSLIYAVCYQDSSNIRISMYTEIHDGIYAKTVKTGTVSSTVSTSSMYNFKGDVASASVTNGSFTIPVTVSSLNFNWVAIE